MKLINHWIDGESGSATAKRTCPVFNSGSGAHTAQVAPTSGDDDAPEGVHFCTRPQAIISRWSDPIHRGVDLGSPQYNRI